MFIILMMMMRISQVDTYVKNYQIIHFKCIQFIVCQLYINNPPVCVCVCVY